MSYIWSNQPGSFFLYTYIYLCLHVGMRLGAWARATNSLCIWFSCCCLVEFAWLQRVSTHLMCDFVSVIIIYLGSCVLSPPSSITSVISLVIIMPSHGTNTAGETYSLECSVTVTGSTDQLTITWLDGGGEISSSDSTRMVSATNMKSDGIYMSILTFNPLATSHAGTYTCRALVGGAMENMTFNLTVKGKQY